MLTNRHLWNVLWLALVLLCARSVPALDPHYPLRHYNYQSWQTDDGLPQNTVRSVLQTHDGYLWFATDAGLVRFDGVNFHVFDKQNTPQLGSSLIYNLFEGQDNTLWISTANGLTHMQSGGFQNLTTKDGLPSDTVWSLLQTKNGTLWALTSAGIARYDGHSFHAIPVEGLLSTSRLIETMDGTLWVDSSQGLYRIHPDHSRAEPILDEPQQAVAIDAQNRVWAGSRSGIHVGTAPFVLPAGLSGEVLVLLATSDGHVWIGTTNGLGEYNGKSVQIWSGAQGSQVSNLFEDRHHAIWAATSRGLARIFNGQLSFFTPQQGLSSSQVLSFYEDREGNLWLGTDSGGVSILRDRKFTTYTSQDGLTADLTRSVFQARSGAMWIGTSGGGVSIYNAGKFSSLTTAQGLSSNVALALAEDSNSIWVGTPDGLSRIENGKISLLTSGDGLADDFVRSLYVDRSGALWIGTQHGLSRYMNGRFASWTAMDGLGGDLVGAVVQDADESFWIGTFGGLTHFANGKFTNYTTQQGLGNNTVTALYQDSTGNLWIGTHGGGLTVRADGRFFTFPRERLPENIYGILEDGAGYLWLSSDKGIFRANKQRWLDFAQGHGSFISPDIYGTADGLRISEGSSGGHPSAWKAHDGTLWFTTLRGIATADPEHLPVNNTAPLVAVEQLSVDDAIVPIQNAVIQPGHTRFAFEYAGLSFVAPQKVRFRYRLEGVDRDWVDAGTRRIAYYTNIPSGSHVFRVIACNNDGVWSKEEAAYEFRLRPHFYQTYWFYLLLLAATALLIYEAYRWRVHSVEASVESRFDAVLAERSRIAREIHDTLAQGFVAVSVQLEVVARLLGSSTDAAREHLEQARSLTRECLAEARTSIWNLRSENASENDLASALTRSVERITAATPVKARVKVKGTYRPLDPRVEAELLRIGQEAMTNVVRHAQARHAELTLVFAEKLLCMTIQDDGRGFDGNPAKNGHYGMTGMRERAEQIGAHFSVNSAPQKGTEVKVEVAI